MLYKLTKTEYAGFVSLVCSFLPNVFLSCFFLAYETEFVVFLAVLEILSCPWAETAHMRRSKRRQNPNFRTDVTNAPPRKTSNDFRRNSLCGVKCQKSKKYE